MKFSLISNSCVSWSIYNSYEPNRNIMLINYTNPFISSWFPDDEYYVRLCENYNYYVSLEPRFGDAINSNWEKDNGSKRHLNRRWGDYLVMFLGDVEIHWIHETNPNLLLKKFKGRLEISKELEPLFLWSDLEMFNIHTEKEREILVNRFNTIKHKSIFLTKYSKEECSGEITKIKFIPAWEKKSQYDRKGGLLQWNGREELVDMFKEIIDDLK